MQRVLVNSKGTNSLLHCFLSNARMSGNRSEKWKISSQQTSLVSFFHQSGPSVVRPAKRRRNTFGASKNRNDSIVRKNSSSCSSFGVCPMCSKNIPNHRLSLHASECLGQTRHHCVQTDPKSTDDTCQKLIDVSDVTEENVSETDDCVTVQEDRVFSEPLPGLFLYEDFLTEREEEEILRQLDDAEEGYGLTWKSATFNGRHLGQRWGVHCNLRTRQVNPAERPLPSFCSDILLCKLPALSAYLKSLQGFIPNEINAIDYRKQSGHSLSAHVDDRHLSKEVIVNISMAGDCTMTFSPLQKPFATRSSAGTTRDTSCVPVHVLLKRRCLQVLTGPARYQYTHGITNEHLHDERRVSLTLRESPITSASQTGPPPPMLTTLVTWWQQAPTVATTVSSPGTNGSSLINDFRSKETSSLPKGLFLFPNFISEEEETMILAYLDGEAELPRWSIEKHTGSHREKRWGVDHDLWSRSLRPPKHAIPHWMNTLLIKRFPALVAHVSDAKVKTLLTLFHPNDVNAIEYRRDEGHSLAAHVDDRQKHTEMIANLSLAGDCLMTYSREPRTGSKKGHSAKLPDPPASVKDQDEYCVRLPRRTLQLLSGIARYEYRHGIANADLMSERRVSITLRETRP